MAILKLQCGVQHYAWGDTEFIPRLLSVENREHEPYAELWMGAHPDLPSAARLDDRCIPLDELIAEYPEEILGPDVAAAFDRRLPYLFKVLSAKAPLSIQAHPSKAAAEAGFARESKAGIPLTAKHRNYRDDNHKPELIAALTDFYGLRGFRPLEEIAGLPRELPELAEAMRDFAPTPAGLRAPYERLMSLTPEDADAILGPLIARLRDAGGAHSLSRDDRAYWMLEADRADSGDDHHDRGLFSIYLLNLVHLEPGEAMYLPSGILHAYLEGSGMEIMANSNNVLRGGLTPKHVDVPELIANVSFEGAAAEIIRAAPSTDGAWRYGTPAREFELHRLEIGEGRDNTWDGDHSADILILVDADQADQANDADEADEADEAAGVTVVSGGQTVHLRRGEVLLVPHGVAYSLRAEAPAVIYRATVPPIPRAATET